MHGKSLKINEFADVIHKTAETITDTPNIVSTNLRRKDYGTLSKRRPVGSAGQIPDRLADQAELYYSNQEFATAFATFAEAIDKLHTMEVVAAEGSRIRRPSPTDDSIVTGVVKSLGASLATGRPSPDFRALAEQSAAYLRDLANEASRCGYQPQSYLSGAHEVERILRSHA